MTSSERCEACECGALLSEFISVVNVTRHLANCPIHLIAHIAELEAELKQAVELLWQLETDFRDWAVGNQICANEAGREEENGEHPTPTSDFLGGQSDAYEYVADAIKERRDAFLASLEKKP